MAASLGQSMCCLAATSTSPKKKAHPQGHPGLKDRPHACNRPSQHCPALLGTHPHSTTLR
ncbi:uncharacterized protein SETTUDRAFT_162788 [Exserohilum turcica Et28A]|uniref:Uncharacterized protein n=1 Tax=Exserohilum turcicum (strain 28A) TaxID=671987 RepID=R0INI4_EXST2|nr:uncharacterized protein SETTUDRAFT_162788 [Exserohilum turcica Et28A]EOA86530.1 hypothetical protein SETTUDRAFT_162788 [Exserohilum turcica Et28A]